MFVSTVDCLNVYTATHDTKQPLGTVHPKTLHKSQQTAIPFGRGKEGGREEGREEMRKEGREGKRSGKMERWRERERERERERGREREGEREREILSIAEKCIISE